MTELIVLGEADWSWLESVVKLGDPGKIMVEFWRKGLGYSMKEWLALPPGSFRVTDYCLNPEDHNRLYELLSRATRDDKRSVLALAMLWLDAGPAVSES